MTKTCLYWCENSPFTCNIQQVEINPAPRDAWLWCGTFGFQITSLQEQFPPICGTVWQLHKGEETRALTQVTLFYPPRTHLCLQEILRMQDTQRTRKEFTQGFIVCNCLAVMEFTRMEWPRKTPFLHGAKLLVFCTFMYFSKKLHVNLGLHENPVVAISSTVSCVFNMLQEARSMSCRC